MDAFSYLSVLLSIILGLSITQILQGLGGLIQHRARVVPYWPALAWALLLLLIDVQVWWALFGLRSRQAWSFLDFLVVLLQVIPLYMLAALVLPAASGDRPLDLRQNYYGHSRWFFSILAASLVASMLKELVLAGHLPQGLNLCFHLVSIGLSVAAALTRRPWFHQANALLAALSFSLYIAVLFSKLQ